jgi:hypothetical protein
MSDERETKADLFRELTLDEANASIDSKTHNMLALGIGLLPLTLRLVYFVISSGGHARLLLPSVVLASLAGEAVLFVTAIVIGAWNYRPTDFRFLLVHGFVLDHNDQMLVDVKETAATTLAEIVESNRLLINEISKRFAKMFWLFTLGISMVP